MKIAALRPALLNEVHARPFESLQAPLTIDCLVFLAGGHDPSLDHEHLSRLLRAHGLQPPAADASHCSVQLGALRVRWERHTEFVSYTFIEPTAARNDGDSGPAYRMLDAEWIDTMPGELLSAQRLLVLVEDVSSLEARARATLREDSLVGSSVADGDLRVYTDFRAGADKAVPYLASVRDVQSTRRLGRYVQRLLEIETYRMMALLALPQARSAIGSLASAEKALVRISDSIRSADRHEEGRLLDELTRLAAEVEAIHARHYSRLAASAAYHALVQARVTELREQRLPGLQTLQEFLDRRLTPAMKTCAAASARLESLSRRIAHASELLRTRVDVEQVRAQNELLASLDRRQHAQLMLQSTVEGLSVMAITYYGAGLVAYLAKPAGSLGWPLGPDTTVALAIPLIAFGTWASLRRLHRRVARMEAPR